MTDNNNRLLFLYEKSIKKEYGLIKFQSRMRTANFPEHLSGFQDEIINHLEIIKFTEQSKNIIGNRGIKKTTTKMDGLTHLYL
ncbi:hypothetical protein [Psychrobacillus sp. NPDC093200]|uniref:hypothetical protein n=1 Tax=Psychrobacillus sp. NPDC093200 TaxID=3390656 RepID=UPI003D02040E